MDGGWDVGGLDVMERTMQEDFGWDVGQAEDMHEKRRPGVRR